MRAKVLIPVLTSGVVLAILFYTYRLSASHPSSHLFKDPNRFLSPFPHLDDPDQPPEDFHPPLRTEGRYILNSLNQRVKLRSVNWYGGSDLLFVPGGLDIRHRNDIARTIRSLGFNSVRLPYSDEMVMDNPLISPDLLFANPDLIGLRALDVYLAVAESLAEEGLGVIINNHITQATWCCGINLCDTAWYNDYLGPACRVTMTEEQWIDDWEMVMTSLVNISLVIGADLRNEPRGLWGTMPWRKWATAAEKAGNRVLGLRNDWLIFVEGVSSSNDLSDVKARPIILDIPDRVVYSAHVYSWSGWGSLEGMYARRPFPSFVKSMNENWGYLLAENLAPVWVGEFGGPHEPNEGDLHYWDNLMRYLRMVDADFGYWALNPRKPANYDNETYGLLEDDWETGILDYRVRDLLVLGRQEVVPVYGVN